MVIVVDELVAERLAEDRRHGEQRKMQIASGSGDFLGLRTGGPWFSSDTTRASAASCFLTNGLR